MMGGMREGLSHRQRSAVMLGWLALQEMAVMCAASGQRTKARHIASAMRQQVYEFANNPANRARYRERMARLAANRAAKRDAGGNC